MKHRRLTIFEGRLFEESHNHDGLGYCLGRMAEGASKQQASEAIHAMPASGIVGHRAKQAAKQTALREAGILACARPARASRKAKP